MRNRRSRQIFRRTVVWLLCAVIALFGVAGAEETPQAVSSRTEAYYTDVEKTYTLPVYAGDDVETEIELALENGQAEEISFQAPEDGLYEIWLSYQTVGQSALPAEMTVSLDGKIPFYELRRVKLKSLWMDDGVFPTDRYGNEIAPTPTAQDVVQEAGISDSAGWTDHPFLFALAAGEHTLRCEMQEGDLRLLKLALRAPETVPDYAGETAEGSALIIVEGEKMASRNKSSIRAAGEFDANLTPYDTEHRKLNFLDGASFDSAGDIVTWAFDVSEAGWYQIGMRYRQSVKADFSVFADLLIDGALPSGEARQIGFEYATGFKMKTLTTSDGKNQTFWLEAGPHTMSLRLNQSRLEPIYSVINRVLGEINTLSLEVTRLSGGTADKYRSYNVREYIPDIEERLSRWADECAEAVEYTRQYSYNGSGSAFSSLTLASDQLRRLAEKPEDLPRRLSELSTGSNSASRMLAQQMQDIAQNDLSIDRILIYQKDAELPESVSFLEGVGKSMTRFAKSFGSQDYAAGGGEEGHLQVWMGRSRQYVELVQNLIDTDFTPETGIHVDISLMPDANKLVLANAAGTAPDVVLSLQYVVPSYLNIRGALYDLTQFEDFGEVAQRFSSGLFIPYTLGDGVYAMPETVNFWVQFYRKDILEALQIEVPDTMDEVKMILPELQRRNMNFYFPTAGMVGMKVFPGTLPLILQSGGSIYADTIGDTTLDSEASLAGFREMTDLFTVYNMPTDVPSPGFYQQFRDGTLPIGIADLATYNLLLNAAPELDSLWDISLFPGLTDAEGNVLRWTTGGAETMAILSQTEMPDKAWEFLKWWSSAETQSTFGSLLQSTYGSEYIWPTANSEAFATLPLKSAHKKVIMEQMEWMTEAPWVLGTYMLERELSNAYISVVVDGMDARRALDIAVKRINRETTRKLEEFGYSENGVMIKDFPTPTVDVVQKYIDAWNESHGAEEGQK